MRGACGSRGRDASCSPRWAPGRPPPAPLRRARGCAFSPPSRLCRSLRNYSLTLPPPSTCWHLRVDKVVLVSWVACLTCCCETPIEGAWITTVRALEEFEFIFLVGPRIQALACSMLLRDTRTWGTGGGAGGRTPHGGLLGFRSRQCFWLGLAFFHGPTTLACWLGRLNKGHRASGQAEREAAPSPRSFAVLRVLLLAWCLRVAPRIVVLLTGCTRRELSPAREVLWWARPGSSHGLVMAQDPSPSRSDAEQSLSCGTDLCSTRLGAVRTPVIVREPEHISAYLFLSYCAARCGLAHVPVKGRSSVTSDLCASRRNFSFSSILLQFCRQQCCMRIS